MDSESQSDSTAVLLRQFTGDAAGLLHGLGLAADPEAVELLGLEMARPLSIISTTRLLLEDPTDPEPRELLLGLLEEAPGMLHVLEQIASAERAVSRNTRASVLEDVVHRARLRAQLAPPSALPAIFAATLTKRFTESN